jgi:hypothetical protein
MWVLRTASWISAVLLGAFPAIKTVPERPLPAFGRDTVLVYKMKIEEDVKNFVVRIAEFVPDRFVEWENASTQGTIFMPESSLEDAKAFVNSRLFEAGVDTKGKKTTTIWLSRKIFRDLNEKKKTKVNIDGIDGWLTLEGTDQMSVEVNRNEVNLPVIKTMDDRKSERWFLAMEDNPLLVKHVFRHYTQTLASITTDRPNTLRWIKGKKLLHPPGNIEE